MTNSELASVVNHDGITYYTRREYSDCDGTRWLFLGADRYGQPQLQIAPYSPNDEPMALPDLLDEYGPLTMATFDPWPTAERLADWLACESGADDHQVTLRLMKLAEEVGEVTAARIGQLGQNPRKGRTHTADDVADELCDVILAAMVALHDFTASPEARLAARLTAVAERAALAANA